MGDSVYKPNVQVTSNAESLAHRILSFFVESAERNIKENGIFRVALSGGHTPKRFYELLGNAPKSLQWEKIHLFWVDERCVPTSSEWSNYKLAVDGFIAKVDIPGENVHRIPTEYDDFSEAAGNYEDSIRRVFGIKKGQIPQFDLIMLGMGVEGHTASLFPDSFASLDTSHLASVVYVLDDELNRITLTPQVLCAAHQLVVLVSGSEKAQILKDVFTSEPDEVKYPIQALWPILDRIVWLVDSDAAKLL